MKIEGSGYLRDVAASIGKLFPPFRRNIVP